MKLNWNTLIAMIVEMLSKRKDKPTPNPVPVPKPEPVPTPKPEPIPEPKPPVDGIIDCHYKDIIHHYNPKSFEDSAHPGGQGVSILFCVRDHYSAVSFNGEPMRLHNNNDEGRDAWTTVDFRTKKPTFVSGTVVAQHKNGKKYRFSIPAGGKSYLDYKGNCFGKR